MILRTGIVFLVLALACDPAARAEVSMDGTVGPAGTLSGPNFLIPANLGTKMGGNLFHSFTSFNLTNQESATFSGPADVQNILARVTGGTPSSIDGTLRSTISGANLFFVNPAGIVFGPNAKLDVSGSFAASTGDYLELADGGVFHASDPSKSVLTTAPPTAFGFLGPTTKQLVVDHSTLSVPTGKTLSVVGGGVRIVGGQLVAQDGLVRVAGAGPGSRISSGKQNFADMDIPGQSLYSEPLDLYALSPPRGPVEITDSLVRADGGGRGGVAILSDALTLTRSQISAASSNTHAGLFSQSIEIISGSATLDASSVRADAVAGIPDALAGTVDISSRSNLTLVNGSVISASSSGGGFAGLVTLQAEKISLSDAGTAVLTEALGGSDGVAGKIQIGTGFALDPQWIDGFQGPTLKQLDVLAGARISTVAAGYGEFASIDIKTMGPVTVNGQGSAVTLDAIGRTDAYSFSLGGGGNLTINAGGSVEISDGAKVTSRTYDLGLGQSSTNGGGFAGTLSVTARNIYVVGAGSELSASTEDARDGGSITLTAVADPNADRDSFDSGTILVADSGLISADTLGHGKGGSISLKGKNISVFGGQIDTSTGGGLRVDAGDGGDIRMVASQSIDIRGTSFISSNTSGTGKGGTISLDAQQVFLSHSYITATTGGDNPIEYREPTVSDLRVELNIEHTYDDDVTASLISPAGTRMLLLDHVGGSGQNFSHTVLADNGVDLDEGRAPFTGSFKPSGFLSFADYEQLNGTWTLEVSDRAIGDTGRLLGWSLLEGSQVFSAADVPQPILDLSKTTSKLEVNAPLVGIPHNLGNGGSVNIHASGSLKIDDSGQLLATTFGSGQGGNVKVTGGELRIEGANLDRYSGIFATSGSNPGSPATAGYGGGGNVTINTGRVTMRGTTTITVSTSTNGDSGTIGITAHDVAIDGRGVVFPAGSDPFYNSIGIFAGTSGVGNAKGVVINATNVSLLHGVNISTSTDKVGNAGAITIQSSALTIDGDGSPRPTGLFAATLSPASGEDDPARPTFAGKGGTISVLTGQLRLLDGGGIATSSLGGANAGNILVTAANAEISGARSLEIFGKPTAFGGIAASTEYGPGNARGGSIDATFGNLTMEDGGLITARTASHGAGGSVKVSAGTVRMLGGAYISAGTLGVGNAGDVVVTATRKLSLDGGATNISSAAESGAAGAGGAVRIVSGALTLSNGAAISAETHGPGSAGSVIVQADSVRLTQIAFIGSASSGSGGAGSVSVTSAGALALSGRSEITTSAPQANAGDIVVHAGELTLDGGSTITASAGSNGGNVTIRATRFFANPGTSVVASAGTLPPTTGPTAIAGRGGNINIDSPFLLIDHATINANAADGQGGDITLVGDLFLDSNSILTATGATAGTIAILAPQLDITSALLSLNAALFDASTRLRDQCARKLQQDFSSYLRLGRGGQAEQSEEFGTSF